MLAVNFGDIGSSRKRDQCPISMEEDDAKSVVCFPFYEVQAMIPLRCILSDAEDCRKFECLFYDCRSDEASPVIVNRMLQQHETELYRQLLSVICRRELRLSLEKKDRELREKTNQIQMLQNQLVYDFSSFDFQSSSSSKVQQFDTLAKSFMEQNGKLKTKEEEVSSLTTVIQK